MISFTVPGPPRGKGRPIISGRRMYSDPKTVAYERLIAAAYRQAAGPGAPMPGPIKVSICATFPIPKSATKAKRFSMEESYILPTVRPDLDNIAKAVLDALNGIAFGDDCQIVQLSASKWYGGEPGLEIEIETA